MMHEEIRKALNEKKLLCERLRTDPTRIEEFGTTLNEQKILTGHAMEDGQMPSGVFLDRNIQTKLIQALTKANIPQNHALIIVARLCSAWTQECIMLMNLQLLMGRPCDIKDIPNGLQAVRKEICKY